MGVRVAVDDFGTGFSSLQYLQRLPIDALKVDKSFIHDITANAGSAAIVEAVIKLAKTYNLQIIDEGIDSRTHLRFIRERGCHAYEGFLFSAPLGAKALAANSEMHKALTI